jgi:excisionase family DNA binding protein
MRRLLVAEEAAALLRLRPSTLRDYTRRGIVPALRIGRHWRYDEAELREWLKSLKRGVEAM